MRCKCTVCVCMQSDGTMKLMLRASTQEKSWSRPLPLSYPLPGDGLPTPRQGWVLGHWAGSAPISQRGMRRLPLLLLPRTTPFGGRQGAAVAGAAGELARQCRQMPHRPGCAIALRRCHSAVSPTLISRGVECLNVFEDLSLRVLIHPHC